MGKSVRTSRNIAYLESATYNRIDIDERYITIRIVTDSTADIPPAIAHALHIAVVPAYVRFGEDYYRDGVDITPDTFLAKLMSSPSPPGLLPPTAADIAATYRRVMPADGCIVSIHGDGADYNAYASALQARSLIGPEAQVEVISTRSISVGLGLLAIDAAKMVAAGGTLQYVIQETKKAITQVKMLAIFNSTEYFKRSRYIGNMRSFIARALRSVTVITFQDGHPVPAGSVINTARGIEKLCHFVRQNSAVEIAIAHTASPHELTLLEKSLEAFYPLRGSLISPLGPAICAHAGPHALLVAVKSAGK